MAPAHGYGKVFMVGAGPGAVDLITVRGARILSQADVVLYDALVSADMLALAPHAEKIPVGKRSRQRSTAQLAINQLLIDCAAKYKLVVRLKGGDPMLFGRADAEWQTLESHGITVEVVPGITTAFAAAASTLQPLTKRGIARSIAFFTSATAPNQPDQLTLPDCDTLIQYMGGREAIITAQKLLEQGRSPALPVVIVENCSLENEQISRMTLRDLQQGLGERQGPVLVMIGEAMAARPAQTNSTDKEDR
jgi:uroporphyrin-III C-methyltransferase